MAYSCQKYSEMRGNGLGEAYSVSGYVVTNENLTIHHRRSSESSLHPPLPSCSIDSINRELAVLAMFLDGLCLLGRKHARNASGLGLWYRRTPDKLVLTAPLRPQASTLVAAISLILPTCTYQQGIPGVVFLRQHLSGAYCSRPRGGDGAGQLSLIRVFRVGSAMGVHSWAKQMSVHNLGSCRPESAWDISSDASSFQSTLEYILMDVIDDRQ
ncbi:uncharacterized protein EURHEDRAFT_522382 [Aspergillus ruber CBS 135680]|uniref:Uncharacterized protein n=1 Tax=Aspergillus ruber (strain CBS 135680) TaxID=1388766 RepID=A0A017SH84_ASPRC|nr:uncharacterized protein EURHEDRAFT_522382 [Aspergillus ruber CBS 135680]EYE96091.1 hypothetical protein EURHEDRAFT_522382 [Aspergillus ruber CBS 135680]